MSKTMLADEKRFWWALRHRLPDPKFRRQFVVGPYITGFCCLSARLVLEVDSNQHGNDDAIEFDARRTALIQSHGFRVLRFSNSDVIRSLDSVLDHRCRGQNPIPTPQQEGEEHLVHG